MELRPRQPVAPFHRARARGGVAAVDLAEQVDVVVRRHRPDRLRGALGRFRVHAAPPADGLDAPHRAHAAAVPRHVPELRVDAALDPAHGRGVEEREQLPSFDSLTSDLRAFPRRSWACSHPPSTLVLSFGKSFRKSRRRIGRSTQRAARRSALAASRSSARAHSSLPACNSACSRRASRPGGRRGRRASAPWPRAAPPSPPTRSPALRRPPPSQAGPWRGAAPSAPASSRRAAAPSPRPGGGAPAPLHRPAAGRADLVIRGQPSSQTTLLVDSRATSRGGPRSRTRVPSEWKSRFI